MAEPETNRPTCAKCGKVHPHTCIGHISTGERKGEPCRQWAIKGGTVCPAHGGAAKNVRAKATERVQQAKAIKALVTYGIPRQVDPFAALLEEISRTAGHVDWLKTVVEKLTAKELVWSRTSTETKIGGGPTGDYLTDTQSAAVNQWLALYQSERIHLVHVCKTAIGCGLAERQVQLAESQGALIAEVLRAVIGDPELGLSPERQEVALGVASRHLRALPAA